MNTCQWCGKTYTAKRQRAVLRWCSNSCKNAAKTSRLRDGWLARSAQRVCDGCGESLAGRRTDTKWCSDSCAQRRPTRRAVARRAHLKDKYGITESQYAALVAAQGGRCAICRSEDSKHPAGTWHVDHDHASGAVRGLLCSRCNTGIGHLQDDPEVLIAAARYITMHRMVAVSA